MFHTVFLFVKEVNIFFLKNIMFGIYITITDLGYYLYPFLSSVANIFYTNTDQ